jgi:hypothetical protein
MSPDDIIGQTVRFPRPLHEQIAQLADDADRSFSQQVVAACRDSIARANAPQRRELETPAPDQAPAFELKPRWGGQDTPPWHATIQSGATGTTHSAPEPDSYVAFVEGRQVPHVKITRIEDEDWTTYEKSIGHSGEGYMVSLDERFAIIAHDYSELWRWGWFIAHCIAIGEGRASHTYASRLRQVIDEGWEVMAQTGSCGRSFEITTTFVLPAVDRGDQWAYEARDVMRRALHDLGCHDVVTRLIALGSLDADRRDDSAMADWSEGQGSIMSVETISNGDVEEERITEVLGVEVDDAVPPVR